MWIFVVKKLPANAMALFPFILIKSPQYRNDPVIINHEKIHFRQQIELLILPFYLLYFLHYLINLISYQQHDLAYRNIVFEREAYLNDTNLHYLKEKHWFGWLRLLNKSSF